MRAKITIVVVTAAALAAGPSAGRILGRRFARGYAPGHPVINGPPAQSPYEDVMQVRRS